ncbi:MAG TPA: hypothetical protein VLO11_07900 [Luteolibacter sp.]|nr:hypothetical protein [Luteolibacter sp.]
MLHLAFGERALLVDEMGLGKTIQAVAACALLHHLGKVQRVKPVLLRRRKREVETELTDRSDRNHFVSLTPAMRGEYNEYKQSVSELLQIAQKRPLTKKQQDLLMILLGIMRMICDSPSIIKNHDCQDCPKLRHLPHGSIGKCARSSIAWRRRVRIMLMIFINLDCARGPIRVGIPCDP